jgi:hypothetical protein
MPGMYWIVLHVARAAPRIAYMRVSLISSSVAPACFAAAKRPGTQEVKTGIKRRVCMTPPASAD